MIKKTQSVYHLSQVRQRNAWHSYHRLPKINMPHTIKPWLTEKNSLTSKLQNTATLTVDVIIDGWGQATTEEKVKLGLGTRQGVRVREVILKLDNIPVIYARSIIPARSLKGRWRYLVHLGNQPLGGFLYKDSRLHRGPIEVAYLPSKLFITLNQSLWARRSVFYQYGKGILVSEAFLPTIETYL